MNDLESRYVSRLKEKLLVERTRAIAAERLVAKQLRMFNKIKKYVITHVNKYTSKQGWIKSPLRHVLIMLDEILGIETDE